MRLYKATLCDTATMTRDMDLIREILLWIDANPRLDGTSWVQPDTPREMGIENHSLEEVAYHLQLLIEGGFVRGSPTAAMPMISRLTWNGHEFLDDIHDADVWEKTKERLQGLSGVALAAVWEIAKAEIKKKLGLP